MNVFRLTPWVPALDRRCRPGAEHEQEQQRLHQRGDHPQPVGAEADQLAAPHDPDRAQLRGEAALRDADADDRVLRRRGGRRRGVVAPCSPRSGSIGSRAHRRPPCIICIITRLRCLDLVLLGVADRRAGVGHEHVVERRARDADRLDRHAELGEQPRHERLALGNAECHGALGDPGLDPEALGQRGDRGVVILACGS